MKTSVVAAVVAWAAIGLTVPAPVPPGVPMSSTARTELAALTVATSGPSAGYSRRLFRHWHILSGTCNTREYVLKRDGTNVVNNSACAATSGTWKSPYDNETRTDADDVDIDHLVALKNAWISGAASWTNAERESFANDIVTPQLWAVTDDINRAKSDKSPDRWKPPVTSFHCTYAKSWIRVKGQWALTITSAEKSALSSMLDSC